MINLCDSYLSFDCVLDETDRDFGECMTYKIFYFLEDDTVSIKELKENMEGRDRFPMLLRRTKLPKNWKRQPVTFPMVYLEITDNEISEFYQPKDFVIGDTIFVFGRKFLLLDCDKFTRLYYDDVLKQPQRPKHEVRFPFKPTPKRPVPEYVGLGTPEDSLASCFGLIPKPPKKDIVTYLVNANKVIFNQIKLIIKKYYHFNIFRNYAMDVYLTQPILKILFANLF